jgi:hypothetical protein
MTTVDKYFYDPLVSITKRIYFRRSGYCYPYRRCDYCDKKMREEEIALIIDYIGCICLCCLPKFLEVTKKAYDDNKTKFILEVL